VGIIKSPAAMDRLVEDYVAQCRAEGESLTLTGMILHLRLSSRQDTRSLVLDNIGLSWVELDGDDHAANRFYLEDLAIGLMRPILNIDVER
jgi:hypothetical protein